MLVTLCFIPVFFTIGIVFGLFSWILAAWVVCGSKDWTEKWQSFSRASVKMSKDHNVLVAFGADFIITFECIKPCRMIGKNVLLQYYKIGHSLSVYFVLFLLTLIKALTLFPIWASICCKDYYNEQLTQLLKQKDATNKETTALTVISEEDEDEDDMQKEKSEKKGYKATSGAYDTSWLDEEENDTFKHQDKFHNLYADGNANDNSAQKDGHDTSENTFGGAYD